MKTCPNCGEDIEEYSDFCSHCWSELSREDEVEVESWEWLQEITMKWKAISKHKVKYKRESNIFVSIIRYILFVPTVIIAVSIFHIVISMCLRLLSWLSLLHRIILIFVLWGLLAGLWSIIVTGITYATYYVLKITPNKKVWGIIFTVLIILLTIRQIIDCFTAPIWTQETWHFLRVVFILLIVGICILLSVLANSGDFEDELP